MKINRHHSRFTAGEYAKSAIPRIDLDDTQVAAEIQENLVPSLSGEAKFRPGTEYIDTTLDNSQARLIPFIRDTDDFALIEMTAGKVRIMVDDAFITRPTVTSTIVNPNFDLATGWTTSTTGNEITQGASYANLQSGTYNNQLVMGAFAQGSSASAVQAVTIPAEELGTVHALRIDVFRGPVLFRIGSTSGGQEVVEEQVLQRGTHSIAFTPTAAIASTYYIWFGTRFETEGVVNSCQFESGGIMDLDAPWTTAELREISFDQASDVVFFAHENWRPRQLTRRGPTSWSMTEFLQDGGPADLVSDGTLFSISSTRNQAVVTSSEDYFSSDMIGVIVRGFHDRLNASYAIAGPGEFTEPWVVRGIKGKKTNDRLFKYRIFGGEAYGTPGTPPFDGVITMQRSITGEDGDYLDHPRDDGTLTSYSQGSGLVTFNGQDEDDNLVAWHRLGFKTDADYVSGFAEINVQYQGMGGYGWGRIIDYYNPRSVLIEIIDKFHSTGEANIFSIGTWGATVSWPSCVALSDNRLWFGGRSQIWASALNDYPNFDDLDSTALRTLTRTLGSGGASSSCRWFLPLQRLIAGTEGSQVSIRSGMFDQGITADNVTLKDAATVGANYVSPIKLDSRGVFVHGSGTDMYVLKPMGNDYGVERMTVHNDQILDAGVVELAAQRQPETMVWAVREDGQAAVCMYEYEEDIDTKAWWRFITAGDVESVAVLPGAAEDRVYMVVNRTPDPDDESITGAEELAPADVDVFSADFTDQSVLVVDSGTPANDLNTDERFDEWGNIVGLETIISSNTSDLKLTMQSSGYLGYQPHNLAPSSYDFTVSGFRSYSGGVVGSDATYTYPAPDGVGVMQKIIPPFQDQIAGIEFDLNVPGAGGSSSRRLVEISFYTKYEVFDSDAMSDWNVFVSDVSDNTTIASCTWFMDQLSGAPENDLLFDGTFDADGNPGFVSYRDDRVLNYTGEPAPSYEAFDQPAIDRLDEFYLRLRYRFWLVVPEAYVRIYPSETLSAANGRRGGYIWGLQCNLLPTAGQLAGGYSQLVQHNDNAPRILLPYEWDNNGVLEGIRTEPAGDNLLASGTNFSVSDFTPTNLIVNYVGSDESPNGLAQGTQLVEDASAVTSEVFLNADFEDADYPTSIVSDLYRAVTIPNWTVVGEWFHITPAFQTSIMYPQSGSHFVFAGGKTNGGVSELTQDRDLTELVAAADIDAGIFTIDFSIWCGHASGLISDDPVEVVLEAFDGGGSSLGELYNLYFDGITLALNNYRMSKYSSGEVAIPVNTRTLRCRITSTLAGGTYSQACFDNVQATIRRTDVLQSAAVHKLSHPIFGLDGQYCASTYVYPGELTYLALRLQGTGGESFLASFNVDTGVVTLESAVGVTNAEAGVEALPYGCYRIWITGTLSVEPGPATMTSTGVTTTSLVPTGEPTITSTGTSTVTWGVEGIEVGTVTMAGTSPPDLQGDSFLSNNLVVNGNFDGGTFYGWDGGIGPTGDIVTTTPPGAYEGNFYLSNIIGDGVTDNTFVSQYIDLTQAFSDAELDSGTAQLDMGMAAIKLFEDASAAAYMGGQWLTAGSGFIANFTAISNNSLPLDTWTELSTTVTIPTTTRILRLYVYDSGSSPDSHSFDAIYVRKAGTPAILEPTLTAAGSSTVTWGPGAPAPLFSSLGWEEGTANGGSNTGTAIDGWTITAGNWYWYSFNTGGLVRIEGDQYVFGGTSTTNTITQTGDMTTAGVTADQIDAGKVRFSFEVWVAKSSTDSTPNTARVLLEYLDASDTLVSTAYDSGNVAPTTDDVWQKIELVSDAVPATARKVRLTYTAIKNGGFFSTAIFFDGASYELAAVPEDISNVFQNPSFELGDDYTTSATGTAASVIPYWSIEQGSFLHWDGPINVTGTVNPYDGDRWIQGRTGAVNELRQDVTILDRYAGLITADEIDNGQVDMDFSIWRVNTAGSDTGRVLVEARDSGGTVISTLYDTGTGVVSPDNTWTEYASTDMELPANTRIVSCRIFVNLVAGTYANQAFDNVTATLSKKSGALSASGTSTAGFFGQAITPFTIDGTATATMSGGGIYPAAMSATGVAAAAWDAFPDYPLVATGTSSVSWGIPPITMTSAGIASASFGPPVGSEAFTMSGSASVVWGAKNATNDTATFSIILSDSEDSTVTSQNEISFAAQGSRGVIVWGAQLEYGRNRPSSFISRTSTSQRAADAYTIDNSSLPLSDTAMSMFAEIKRSHAEAGTILGIADGSDALNLELDSSAQSLHRVRDDGGDVAYIVDGVTVENTLTRLASSAQVDDAKFVVDGGSALTDTSLTMAAVSGGTTFIGSGYDGIISRIMILPQASTEAELQAYGLAQDPPVYRYIEKVALQSEAVGGSTNKMADSGAFFAGPASTVTCAWLVERTDIVAWATNASGIAVPLTGLTSDVDGNIALGDTYTNIWVGLAYTARYRSGKLAFDNRGGTALLQRKRIAELGLLLEDTHRDAIRFGADFDRMRHMNLVKAGAIQPAGTIYSTYDGKSFSFPGRWDTDSRLCIQIDAPYPATLQGLVIGLEWNERGLG